MPHLFIFLSRTKISLPINDSWIYEESLEIIFSWSPNENPCIPCYYDCKYQKIAPFCYLRVKIRYGVVYSNFYTKYKFLNGENKNICVFHFILPTHSMAFLVAYVYIQMKRYKVAHIIQPHMHTYTTNTSNRSIRFFLYTNPKRCLENDSHMNAN